MKVRSVVIATSLLAISALAATVAQAGTVVVPATGSIWLAGQPAGATVTGYFSPPGDTAPASSPTELQVTGPVLTFSASGSYSVNGGDCFDTAAGGCYSDESEFSPSPWSGDYTGPDALVGIFLSAAPTLGNVGGYEGPLNFVSGPDYTDPANIGPGTYSPALDQIFYIGTGSGEVFNAPAGATTVDLAVLDAIGGSNNNSGALTVSFTGATSTAPEPSMWAMMLIGVGAVGAAMRWRGKAGLSAAAA